MGTKIAELVVAAEQFCDDLYRALTEDLAEKMTCGEAESTAALYHALGRVEEAEAVIEAHSYSDTEPEDLHRRADTAEDQ